MNKCFTETQHLNKFMLTVWMFKIQHTHTSSIVRICNEIIYRPQCVEEPSVKIHCPKFSVRIHSPNFSRVFCIATLTLMIQALSNFGEFLAFRFPFSVYSNVSYSFPFQKKCIVYCLKFSN